MPAISLPISVDAPTIVHGDALETMRLLPAGSVHLILVDPPYYKVKGDAWDRQWKTAAEFLAWMGELADEWRRILAPNGSLYVFASPQMAARVECVIAERFAVLNSIVWAKDDGWQHGCSRGRLRSYHPASERVIFAGHEQRELVRLKGTATRTGMAALWLTCTTSDWEFPTADAYEFLSDLMSGLPDYDTLARPFDVASGGEHTDVWTFSTVQAYPGKHPCEKPRAMIDHIITASSRPGDVVLDCFLGSGVTIERAVALGRRGIGIEKGDYIHGARRRIYAAIGTPAAAAEANAVAPVGSQLGLL